MMDRVELRISLPPGECLRRLKDAAEPDRPIQTPVVRVETFLTRFRGDEVRIRIARPLWRNSLAPLLYGRFDRTLSGSTLQGRFRMHPFVRAFMTFWLVGVIALGGFMAVAALWPEVIAGTDVDDPWLGVAVPIIMVIVGVMLIRFARGIGESDREDILWFLEEVLGARTHVSGTNH